jgi:hydrogenase maturation factor
MVREEAKLKVIRDQMVNDLKAKGVNPRYLSEMINVDVGKMLRR